MRLFRWNRAPSDEPDPSLPWAGLPSIATFLAGWDGDAPLPDEPTDDDSENNGQIRFAPGALDGIMSHHAASEEGGKREHEVARLLDLVERAAVQSDDACRAALYRAVQSDDALRLADDLSEAIAGQKRFGPHQLHPLASWLHDHAAHRGPFKIALILLGLCGRETDLPQLVRAARHPEFTLFALVAASNIAPDPTQVWWQMAREADGWGKIHLVERLAQLAFDNRDLQDWLLREGCANSVMDEYLAWLCAHYGDLRGALERGEHDDALLDGAGRILVALTNGGPAQDMSDYEDGPAATRLYLEAIETRCDTVWRLFVVATLDSFFVRISQEPSEDGPHWHELGWTPEVVADLRALCAAPLQNPNWPTRLEHELEGENYWWAWECAQSLNLDLWEPLFARLEKEPTNASLYSFLLSEQPLERQRRVADFARAHLPMAEIISAPSTSPFAGSGASFCLDLVLWAMKTDDGVQFFDETLLEIALRASALRTRSAAVTVLESVPLVEWSTPLAQTVRQRQSDEPDEELRDRLKQLA